MFEEIVSGFRVAVPVLEFLGATALIAGFLAVTAIWLVTWRRRSFSEASERYRTGLGRVILAGLEILVAAAVVKTVTQDPTLESMIFLAIMVAIRTFLGWTTVLEMSGRWPWRGEMSGNSDNAAAGAEQ